MHIYLIMNQTIKILSALAEPTRFEAMRILWNGGELCVCELMKMLGKSQSTISRHMAVLKRAGLVVDRRDAQWVRYRLNPKMPSSVVALVKAAFKNTKEKGFPKKQAYRKAKRSFPF